ncbi:MAG TPA: lysylphosphatidylglycerol synthase transmembrane domain-containing protein [Bryobacteraceae bacterium]|jgi:hypothetical protein|nr:lysylphosphatidylglycerol synthase transmembrane domain-containing protein [Bryobacteraceae bacterium]
MKGESKRGVWSWMVAVPLAAVLLWWTLRGVDWATVWGAIKQARWGLVVCATPFTCLSFFLRAMRWRILLNAEENLPVGTVFLATMAGYLGNAFLPARAGEVVRTLVVSGRSKLSKTYVLTTALSERLMDAVALVLWSSLILLGVHPKPGWMAGVARTMAIVAGAGAVAIAVLPHIEGLFVRVLKRAPLPHKLREALIALADQVLLGMRAFHNTGRFVGFAAMTVVIWVSDDVGFLIAAHALHLALSFSSGMLLLAALGLASALPSTPGYVGIFQFVAVTVLAPMGIAKSDALAFILVVQAYGYLATLLLGLPCLWILRRRKA